MKIRTQAILGTTFVAVSVLSLGALILSKQIKAESRVKLIVGVYNQRILLARDLQELMLRLSRSERNYLLFDDPIYLDRTLATGYEIDQTAQKLKALSSPTGKGIINQFMYERNDYRGMTNQMVSYLHLGRKDKSKEITRQYLRGAADKMDELLDKIIQNNREAISESERDALRQMVLTRYFTIGTLAFIVIFATGGWILIFKANRALRNLKSGIQSLEEKNFNPLPSDPSKKDEINTVISAFNRMMRILKDYVDRLNQLAVNDGLTGLYNHRYFQERLDEEIRRSSRSQMPFAVVMLDLDHFKNINDAHGHRSGDAVLQHVARTVKSSLRQTDWVARYGGEEFVIVMPGTEKQTAYEVAEKVRMAVERWAVILPSSDQSIHVTVSCGVAAYSADGLTKDDLIQKADSALYQAKNNGRNRTELFKDGLRIPVEGAGT